MTHDRNFKRIVRARMAATGENYTQARAALLDGRERPDRRNLPPQTAGSGLASPPVHESDASWEVARREHKQVVRRFFNGPRLRSVPTRRKVRASVLLELLARFTPRQDYTEVEVNAVLRTAHEDVAYLRRELVNYGYLTRSEGVYRVAATAPRRVAAQAQEIPVWESLWLPGFLAGGQR